MKIRRSLFALSFALPIFAVAHASAQAPTVIDSVPYTITTAGKYTLSHNLTSTSNSESAITVNAPNVILDLNGFFITGPSNPKATNSSFSSVIYVGNVANTVIRNGTVSGHAYGILLSASDAANSRNYVIDSVVVTRCYIGGIDFNVAAPGSVVRNCLVSVIGKSTLSANMSAYGIYGTGGIRIENNNVSNVSGAGTGKGYAIETDSECFSVGNTISRSDIGIFGGKYLNNLTANVTTPFEDGVNATGNN